VKGGWKGVATDTYEFLLQSIEKKSIQRDKGTEATVGNFPGLKKIVVVENQAGT